MFAGLHSSVVLSLRARRGRKAVHIRSPTEIKHLHSLVLGYIDD